METNQSSNIEPARSQPMDERVKSESLPAESPHISSFEAATPSSSSHLKSPSLPIPSTETNDNTTMGTSSAAPGSKKKGTASVTKKAPKRAKTGRAKKSAKKAKTDSTAAAAAGEDEDGSDEESDNGPYCICRGPDDHRWMICCEYCDDWFHGECINLDKSIGETLIEKFVCPNCTSGNLTTLYKKKCTLGGCKKAARLTGKDRSVFCSNDHANLWWERIIGRLPKSRSKAGQNDQLTQDELMALLDSGYANIDKDGNMKLAKLPFQEKLPAAQNEDGSDDESSYFLTEEEKTHLKNMANIRYHLAQDTLLCHKMIALTELAQERRKAAIKAGRFGEDICGYDQRLDSIMARDAFAAFITSPEGEAIYKASKLGDPLGEGDLVRGMCERKRCKAHGGWAKMLTLGIKHQIREMAGQAEEVSEEERIVRAAAGERWQRKKAEQNWVEIIEG